MYHQYYQVYYSLQYILFRGMDYRDLAHVTEQGNFISARLHGIAAQSSKVRAVRGMGFMWGVDVVDPAKDIIGRCMEAGMLVCSAGEHTLRLLPPLVMTRDELARGLQLLELAIG
ncbi:MAG: aminotransferase class III-fold pyridoxal phosphate-dependent enzyme [Betaproteobacteria bacterium]|nr:aminotransferase class III-fold pyridoxal phosphate-dependent enzyme [Betaproteobacteria bacterium]